jgi:hypothetical protein
MKELCDYGCGQGANYQFKNGKKCCSKTYKVCPGVREKLRQRMIGKRTGMTYVELYGEEKAKAVRDSISNGLAGKAKGIALTPEIEAERKRKISKSIKERYALGWMPKAGRCKKIRYSSPIAGDVLVDGTWELAVAKYFDQNSIKWIRNKQRFKYWNRIKGMWSYYTPDFYLEDLDAYIEVKGYETELDKCKWSQFEHRLIVWKKEEVSKIKKGIKIL